MPKIYLNIIGGIIQYVNKRRYFKHVKENFGTSPDYPFQKFPNYAALRHESNEKWYGLVMNVLPEKLGLDGDDEIDILNLKSPPK